MQLFANNAATVLAASAGSASTLLTVANGALFPAPSGSDYFLVTLIKLDANGNETGWEVCKTTFRNGNELTVIRAQEGTSAQSWAAGDRVRAAAATH
ncbi:hypothetical protein [Thauera aromatica]|uniref:hypothetical protein n=1 Tax=Thauera aromatica TaxID=59405 RepID=UPI001FFCEE35|nr:hypothetical protein [Thauera aromatica]MCK2097518.1 hypothetical protein [Thauera aromatica]